MNKALKDLYDSAGPEQKLTILPMEMVTPQIIEWINKTVEAADELKRLLHDSG